MVTDYGVKHGWEYKRVHCLYNWEVYRLSLLTRKVNRIGRGRIQKIQKRRGGGAEKGIDTKDVSVFFW